MGGHQAVLWFKKLGGPKVVINVGKIIDKYDILRVEEKQRTLIGTKTKRSLEMNQLQRELETRRLTADNIPINKRIKG